MTPVEARERYVIEMLQAHPGAGYAFLADPTVRPDGVVITLAFRDRPTCELLIPREKYDPFLLLALMEQHWSKVH